ncbi:unnamed protein product [Ilex paraguariensis]|uniref:CASP-like protein n=1 Tax=Ilex paraguariensis TaxID=185542 RepID=A0ABC8URM3_9AQUA
MALMLVIVMAPLVQAVSALKMKAGPLEASEASMAAPPTKGLNKGISIVDLVLRVISVFGTLGSAVAMGTTDETLPFFTPFTSFRAEYNDLPSFTFFVVANSVVCGYLALSLPLSIYHIARSKATVSRVILIFFDTAMLALLTAGASAATAIVYLAHKGNASANWFAVCQQFNDFCERISGALIGSFGGIVLFILLILMSAISLSRHR